MIDVVSNELSELSHNFNDLEIAMAEESYTEINKIVNHALDLVSDFSDAMPIIAFTYDFNSRMEVTMMKPPKGVYAPAIRIFTLPRGILLTNADLNDFEPSTARVTDEFPKPKLSIELLYKQDDNEDSDAKVNKYPNIDKEMNVEEFMAFVDIYRPNKK